MGIAAEQWLVKKKSASKTTSGTAANAWLKKRAEDIPSMLSEIESNEKELQSLYQKRGSYWDGNYNSVMKKALETNELIKRTQSLLKYTDAYDTDELTEAFGQYSQYNNDILSRLNSEAEVYGKFTSEDEYKAFEADYLKKKEYSEKTSEELEAELQRMQTEREAYVKENGGVFGNKLAKYLSQIGNTPKEMHNTKLNMRITADERISDIDSYDEDISLMRSILDDKKLSELPDEVLTELDSIINADDSIEMQRQMQASVSASGNTMNKILYDGEADLFLIEKEKRNTAYKKLESMGYDKDTIEELTDRRKRYKNAEMTEDLIATTQQLAKDHPVLTGAFSVATSLTRGIANLTDAAKKMSGEEIDENDIYHSLGTFTDTVRSTHTSEIDSYAGRIAYNAVMGIADNAARMAVGGGVSSVFGGGKTITSLVSGIIAGSQSMEQEIVNGKQKGYSDSKAFGIALTKSVFEAGWEFAGDNSILGSAKNVFLKILKAALVEGGTEVATNWTNRLIDIVVDVDDNDLTNLYNNHLREGDNASDALLETVWDIAGEDFETFLVGTISGMAMGGSVEAARKAADVSLRRETARQLIENGSLSELIDTAKELKNSELDSLIKKLDTEKVKVKDVARLQSKMYEITSKKEEAEYKTELKRAISNRLETLGSVQTEAVTDAVYKFVLGKRVNGNDRKLLLTDSAKRVISEYENRQSGEYTSDWTDLSRRAVNDGDIGTRTLKEYAVEYADTAAAEDFEESYEQAQAVDTYASGYKTFYELGQTGKPLQMVLSEYTAEKAFGEEFTQKQAMNAYHSGWMEGMTSATDTLKTVKLPDESFESIREAELSNGVSLVNVRSFLNTSMRTQLSILDNYGKEKGLSFAVVENYSGVYDGAKGEQLTGTNKIILNLKSDGGLILHTAGHEVFHYIKQQNEKVAEEIIRFVTDYYKKIGKYDSIRANYEYLGDDALIDEEITADSMFDVMTNSDFINEYASKNKTVFEKIKTAVTELLAHIKRALKLLSVKNPAHKEIYETLSKDKKTLEKINEMFKEATKDFSPEDKAKARERLQEVKLSPHYDNISQESRRQIENNEDFKKFLSQLREKHQKVDGMLVDRAAARDIAKKIKKEYQSKINEKELTDKLCIIYEFLGADGSPADGTLIEVTSYLAKEVLENSEVTDNDLYMQYEPLRNFLLESKISLTSVQQSELRVKFGSVEAFRKKNFGKVHYVKDGGRDLDVVWADLSRDYKEFFDPDISEGDMPETLLAVMNSIRPMVYNPYKSDIDAESYVLMKRIINEYSDTPYMTSVSSTQLRESLMEEFKADQRLAKKKREIREKTRNEREKIKKTANALADKLESNSAKKHVPEVLKKPVFDLIESIIEDSQTAPFNSSLAVKMAKLRSTCENIQNESVEDLYKVIDIPADFVKKLDAFMEGVESNLERYKDSSPSVHILDTMNLSQLTELDQITTTLSTAINQVGQFHRNSMYKNIEDARQDTIDTCLEREENVRKYEWKMHDFFRYKHLLPQYFFKHLGKGAQSLFEEMKDGWDELAFLAKDIKDFAEKTYKPEEVNRLDKEEVEIYVIGDKITMTKSQLMSLYCLWQRPQARKHILIGGITPDAYEIRTKRFKKDTVRHTRNYKISKELIEKAFEKLSDREIEIAEDLQKYMSTVCAEWGNQISMRRFGTKLFTEKHYFPIAVDKGNLSSESNLKQVSGLYDLLNMSFTKDTNVDAENAVMIQNIFDVFVSHSTDMAKYKSLALPLLDILNWYNSQSIGKGGETIGVKKVLKAAYGEGSPKYFEQFIKDINGANTSSDRLSEFNPWLRRYKIAKVAANLNVSLVQPMAYCRAANVISSKYLFKALRISPSEFKKAMKRMEENCGIAVWKLMGFYDVDISKGLGKIIRNDGTINDKIVDITMKPTEWADKMTWTLLYRACEAEAFDNGKAYGSRENAEYASKRFRELIYATQVVDSVMTRSEGMRSKSTNDQLLTAFMSEPTTSYNMILDEIVKYTDDIKEGKTAKQALEKNWKTMRRCFLSYTVTEVLSAAVQAVSGALRDEDDEKFDKKYSDAFLQNLIDNLIVFNKIPIIKKFSEGLISLLRQESPQDSNMIDKLKEETTKPFKTVWNAIQNKETDKLLSYNSLYALLVAISDITGVPVSNAVREVIAIWNTVVGSVNEDLKIRRFDVSVTEKIRTIMSGETENVRSDVSELIEKQTKERQKDHPKETLSDAKKEATSTVKSKVSTVLKEMYLDGEKDTAISLLRRSGLYTEKEIARKTESWRLEE